MAQEMALHALLREVYELQRISSTLVDGIHKKTGLPSPQRKVLRCLVQEGPQTVPDIAFSRGIKRQSVQSVVNTLKTKAFVEIQANPRHKTSKLIAITPAGREAFDTAGQAENALLQAIHLSHSDKQLNQAAEVLSAINTAVQEAGEKLLKTE